MKKRKTAFLLISVMFLVAWLFFNYLKESQIVEKSNLEIVKNWFPDLDDMQSVQLYTRKLGDDNSRIPGPSTFYVEGIISMSGETSEKYLESYDDWKAAEIGEVQGTLEMPDCEWFYSGKFEADIKPSYYYGKVFLSETGYLFFFMMLE